MNTLSPKTQRAVKAYTETACIEAYRMHKRLGYGASSIAVEGPEEIKTTRQADAAIDAGEELCRSRALHVRFTKSDSVDISEWVDITIGGLDVIERWPSDACWTPRHYVLTDIASKWIAEHVGRVAAFQLLSR